MKVKGKVILYVFIAYCLYSCTRHGNYVYETTQLHVHNANNSANTIQDENTDSVEAKAYAVKVEMHNVVTDFTGKNKDENESHYQRKYPLTFLEIYTLQDFDTTHLANSSISDYFLYHYGAKYTISYMVNNHTLDYPNDRPNPNMEFDEIYYFKLMKLPENKGKYTFKVIMEFADGSHFMDTTIVKLLK